MEIKQLNQILDRIASERSAQSTAADNLARRLIRVFDDFAVSQAGGSNRGSPQDWAELLQKINHLQTVLQSVPDLLFDPVIPVLQKTKQTVEALFASQAPRGAFVYDTAWLRQIRAEMTAMDTLFADHPLQDLTTEQIKQWKTLFAESLKRNDDKEAVVAKFTQILQKLLVEALYETPMEEEAYLGSDGYTYGKKALLVWLHGMDVRYWGRSPFDPTNPAPFTVRPHPIARHMVQWLKTHNAELRPPKLEALEKYYKKLQAEGSLPLVPTARNEAFRNLKMMQARYDSAEPSDLSDEIKQMLNKLKEDLIRDRESIWTASDDKMNAEAAKIRELLSKLEQAHKVEILAFAQAIAQLRKENAELKARAEALQQQMEKTEHSLEETEKGNAQLNVSVAKLENTIAEAKANRMSDLLGMVCIVGAMVAITYVSGGSFSSVQGGAKGGIIGKF